MFSIMGVNCGFLWFSLNLFDSKKADQRARGQAEAARGFSDIAFVLLALLFGPIQRGNTICIPCILLVVFLPFLFLLPHETSFLV